MEFFLDAETVKCLWEPRSHLAGYGNVLHGGIQSTIHDEIASWVVYTIVKTAGVTANLNVKYKNPVFTNKGKIEIRAKLVEQNRKFAVIHTELFDNEGKLCSEAKVKYFIFPLEIAKSKFNYPGVDAFFE